MKSLIVLGALFLLTACAQPGPPMTAKETEKQKYLEQQEAIRQSQSVEVVPVAVSCYGHGAGYIYSFYVQETWHGQFSRGMVWGGSGNCGTVASGYPVPRVWTPGMKVLVRWKPDGREWIEKTTTIPRYDKVGMLYVHFFPNDEVRVVVSQVGALNPNHPIPPTATVPPPEPEQ